MFWKNKKVLVTGHTGFKGTWLCLLLHNLGAQIYGVCRPQCEHPKFYQLTHIAEILAAEKLAEIQNYEKIRDIITDISPDLIFHLAAQPLVKQSYRDPMETFKTNCIGSLNVLEAVRTLGKPCIIVNVTTDKVYKNLQLSDYAYQETDALGGNDPYSASKAAVELISQSYEQSFFKDSPIRLATARAGNVIGGGDFSTNRLIPDIIRSLIAKQPIVVRHPQFIRPWQHVLDALYGYIVLAEKLHSSEKYIGAYNFGPDNIDAWPVKEVVEKAIQTWGEGSWAELTGQNHEEAYLMLSSQKAMSTLGWKPKYDIDKAITKTVDWYKAWHHQQDMKVYSLKEIESYLSDN